MSCQRLVIQFALGTFKCPQIGTSKAGLDTDQHYANLALGAARPLDHGKRRLRGTKLTHVMLRASGGSATLSVTDIRVHKLTHVAVDATKSTPARFDKHKTHRLAALRAVRRWGILGHGHGSGEEN
jgi:hypothetical protein